MRYNISQNDGNSIDDSRYFLMNNTADGLQIYDNDVYTYTKTTGLVQDSTDYSYTTQPIFENNLVFNQSPNGVCYINTKGSNPWFVDYNDLYGYGSCKLEGEQTHAISGNPDFTSPPAGAGRNSASTAYTLTQNSPAFCQGAEQGDPILSNGGIDFAGTPLPSGAVDAGALEKGDNIC